MPTTSTAAVPATSIPSNTSGPSTPLPDQASNATAATPHACDDGSHGCDKGEGGICYKVDERASNGGWLCDCEQGYKCTTGCESPHEGHTCEKIAAAATTGEPTVAPDGAAASREVA